MSTGATYSVAGNGSAQDFTFTVTDSAGTPATANKTLSLNVLSALQVTSPAGGSLPNATVGAAYPGATLSAVGGIGGNNGIPASTGSTGSYTWSVSPALPAGLSLNSSTGQITGTPTASNSVAAAWSTMSTSPSPSSARPSARGALDHTLWTGKYMLIWGGEPANNTGGLYDPATDEWVAKPNLNSGSSSNTPSARFFHCQVWTGSKLMVWGGTSDNSSNYLSDGGVYDLASDTWSPMVASPLSGRIMPTAVWTGSMMLIWGGKVAGGYANDGAVYNPATNSWTMMASAPTPLTARWAAESVWTGSEMFLWGGANNTGSGTYTSSGGLYNPSTNTWRSASTFSAPSGRQAHTIVWTGSNAIVWGGTNDGAGTGLNTGAIYDPTLDTWTTMSTDPLATGRVNHEAFWTGSRMVVYSGTNNWSSIGLSSDGAVYDPRANKWSALPSGAAAGQATRSHPAVVWSGSQMLVWGGYNGSNLDTGFILTLLPSYTFTVSDGVSKPASKLLALQCTPALTITSPGGSSLPSATVGTSYSQTLTASGGSGSPYTWSVSPALPTGLSLSQTTGQITGTPSASPVSTASDSWTATATSASPSAAMPAGRWGHSVLWTGDKMIVWGGFLSYGGYTRTNTGGVLNPNTNSWESKPNLNSGSGAPGARESAIAVWTGSRLIVWGGFGGSGSSPTPGRYSDGGIYDLATDTWTTLQSVGAPSARYAANAVWTGTKLIIWGGDASGGYTNTGGIYDPVTNTWTSVSTINAPSARVNHAQVWTGSCMIVWGGWTGSASLNNGAMYDPVSDTWASISAVGAPNATSEPSFAWTGSKLIVWGGSASSSTTTNAGGLYDPVTNTWSSMSTVGAPSARTFHTGVWASNRFIVWGGSVSTGAVSRLSDGGAYDPESNTWTATTSTSTLGRVFHRAVWTGTQMIVWGGEYNGSASTNTGAIYTPKLSHTVTLSDSVGNSASKVMPLHVGANSAAGLTIAVPEGNSLPTGNQNLPYSTQLFAAGGTGGPYSWSVTPALPTGLTLNTSTGAITGTLTSASSSVTPTWETLTTTGAPVARHVPSEVWTGSKALFWGGSTGTSGSGTIQSGGIYDATTGQWTDITTTGAPTGRAVHTAIWTGSKMIIWGGNSSSRLDTGGLYDPVANAWSATSTTSAPTARDGHTAIWTGTKMVIWGGSGSSIFGDGASYDPVTNSWTAIPVNANASARYLHTAVWTGSRMIIWGGYNGSYLNSGASYDPSTGTWSAISTSNAPSARASHKAVWTGSRMMVWGGYDSVGDLSTGAMYDPVTDSWTSITTTNAPSARHGFSMAWTGGSLAIWGGRTGSTYLANGGVFNVGSNAWTTIASSGAPSARAFCGTVWTGSRMLVWGGRDSSSYFNSGGLLSFSSNHTFTVSDGINPTVNKSLSLYIKPALSLGNPTLSALPSASVGSTYSASLGGVTGGNGGPYTWSLAPGAILPAGLTLNPSTGQITGTPTGAGSPTSANWTATPTTNAPGGGYYGTAVWTGSSMIVWGGRVGSSSYVGTGGVFDPTTSIWTTITAAGAPAARGQHTAVWTGTKMIVWGGKNSAYLNNGAIYDPTLNSWSSMSGVNAPAARDSHTAVWTGSKMIVWGGFGSGSFADGGIYDPVTDSWTPIPAAVGVTARLGHTAVWTGSKMLIWGGTDGGQFFSDGFAFDPTNLTWTTLASANAIGLSGRSSHVAVWTGKRMVVWGGETLSTAFSTGGVYDPETDAWQLTSTSAAPSARSKLAAVWTGSRMLVWGGRAGPTNSYVSTGASYDPLSNAWTALPTTGAVPSERGYHNAVWTGTSMIVWQGTGDGTSVLNTGGIYTPVPSYTFYVTDGSGIPQAISVTIPVSDNRPVITQPAPAALFGMTGTAFALQLSATGGSGPNYTWGIASGALPTGLTISSTTGVISGTPTSVGSFSLVVQAANGANPPGTLGFTIQIQAPSASLSISSPSGTSLTSAAIGQSYSATLAASGGTGPYSWSVTPALPAGLSLNTSTGAITGTPTQVTPTASGWKATSTTAGVSSAVPSARWDHIAVWTGSKMIVWGGRSASGTYLSTGGIYDPATNTWESKPNLNSGTATGCPSARFFAGDQRNNAIWTGSKLIIWGGYISGPSTTKTGGAYDPVTDTWDVATATALATFPLTARAELPLIWTGTEIVVYGGVSSISGGAQSDGAAFNPTTLTWRTLSSVNNPGANYAYNAIWTGTEVIVHGGGSGASKVATAKAYNPTTDTWRTLTSSAFGRAGGEAVWTGTHMLVWGGWNGSSYLNSGELYHPATNTWKTVSAASGLNVREAHTMVWTGQRALVWGGTAANPTTVETVGRTGASYDPVADVWTSIGTVDAPSLRYDHTAVWTGSQMIVWGGTVSRTSGTNSGGVYSISGYPSAQDFTFTVTDSAGTPATANKTLSLNVLSALQVTSPAGGSLPNATVGAAYPGATLSAVGGIGGTNGIPASTGSTGNYTWSVSPALPAGLSLNSSTGQITGTPAASNSVTAAWTAMSTTGAPTPRTQPGLIWTGTRAIVWGGWASGYTNSGGMYDPASNSWTATSVSGSVPSPRMLDQHSKLVWTGSRMLAWGGQTAGNTYSDTGASFDPTTNTWTVMASPPAGFVGRFQNSATWTGASVIYWGGTHSGGFLNTGAIYRPSTDSWSLMSTVNAPSPRSQHVAVWTGSKLVVWGGWNGTRLDDGAMYDPAADTWTTMTTTNAPSPREYASAAWTGSVVIVWGIGAYGTNTGGMYNPSNDTWTSTNTSGAPSSREGQTAVWTGSRFIVWGGHPSGSTGEGAALDPVSNTWTPLVLAGNPGGRNWPTSVWTGSQMIVWGGDNGSYVNTGGVLTLLPSYTFTVSDGISKPASKLLALQSTPALTITSPGGSSLPSATVGTSYSQTLTASGGSGSPYTWSVSPALPTCLSLNQTTGQISGTPSASPVSTASDSWTATASAGSVSLASRASYDAVWSGTELIVFGGASGNTPLDTGGRFNPSTNTWTSMLTPSGISLAGRFGAVSVWTGSRYMVWGGVTPSGVTNTGGVYNPTTNTWASMSTTNGTGAPASRTYAAAAWAGDRMIVWGGGNQSGSTLYDTGKMYFPDSDSWSDMSSVNAPSARQGHILLWTGKYIIVWGGQGSPYKNDGKLFDPVSNTWTTMSASPLVGRTASGGVWTGTKLIVWGGLAQGNTTFLADGAAYDVASNTWQLLSTVGAPSGRYSFSTVWTGSKMIVFGGHDGSWPVARSDGFAYDLSSDTWSPIAGGSLPGARASASAVWTGTAMLFWGGYSNGHLNTGGIYTPLLTYNITVSDSVGNSKTADFPLNVTGTSVGPAISPPSSPSLIGSVGAPFSLQLSATGGTPATYSWSIATGTLPTGLSIASATGLISGTPITSGTSQVTLRVTDGVTTPGTLSVTFTIYPQLTISAPIGTALQDGAVGLSYSSTFTASGGNGGPYLWSVNPSLPSGLTLGSVSGVLSGTPTVAGSFNLTFTASDGVSAAAQKTMSLTIYSAVSFSNPTLPNGVEQISYSSNIASHATGGKSSAYSFTLAPSSPAALPSGLSLSTAGLISGAPSPGTVGSYSLVFRVTDGFTTANTGTVTLQVLPGVLTWLTPVPSSPWGAAENTAFSAQLRAAGGVGPRSFAVASGSASSLPSGITLNPASGLVSGTPALNTATPVGSPLLITFRVTDGVTSLNQTASLTITPSGPLSWILAPATMEGRIGSAFVGQLQAAGGVGPRTYSVAPTSPSPLPNGLVLGASTGAISGTPAAGTAGVHSVIFRVTDGSSTITQTTAITITVPPPLAITDASLPRAVGGQPYSFALTSTGGSETGFVWALDSANPALPSGFALSSTGVLTGSPTMQQNSRHTLTIRVTDSATNTVTKAFTLAILQPGASSILLTEMQAGGGSYVEFANTGTLPVDVTSWRIRIWNGSTTATTLANPTLPLGTICVPGDSVSFTSSSSAAAGAFPAFLLGTIVNFSASGNSAAALYDSQGNMIDFVMRGALDLNALQSEPSPVSLPTSVTTNHWSGAGVAASSSSNISRTGLVDTNTGSDWLVQSFGTPVGVPNPYNPGLPIAPLAVVTTSIPDAQSGLPYSATLIASGGTRPYTWSASLLPTWLSINPATGVLSGTAPSAPQAPTGVLVAVSGGASTGAYFTVEVVASAQHRLTISSPTSSTSPGSTVDVIVSLENLTGNAALAAISFELSVSAGADLEYVSTTIGQAASGVGKSIAANGSGRSVTIVIQSFSNSVIPSGAVAIVRFRVPTGTTPAQQGSFGITLSSVVGSSAQAQALLVATGSGSVTLVDNYFLPEDVNRDGIVDVVDVQLCVNMILGISLPQYAGQGDANGDSTVDVVDVQRIVNRVLGIG